MLVTALHYSQTRTPPMPKISDDEGTYYSLKRDGTPYGVYGILFIKNRVEYLVCRTGWSPCFIPSQFFEITDPTLPTEFKICNTMYSNDYYHLYEHCGITCLIGYHELAYSIKHYYGINEYEEDAHRFFFRVKNRIDLELYKKII